MFRGQKKRLFLKNNDNWHLGLNNNIFICAKCHKYNSIMEINKESKYQNCLFCGNPNYINK